MGGAAGGGPEVGGGPAGLNSDMAAAAALREQAALTTQRAGHAGSAKSPPLRWAEPMGEPRDGERRRGEANRGRARERGREEREWRRGEPMEKDGAESEVCDWPTGPEAGIGCRAVIGRGSGKRRAELKLSGVAEGQWKDRTSCPVLARNSLGNLQGD